MDVDISSGGGGPAPLDEICQQLSCLGTTDKEVLVSQLQVLIGPRINSSAAHFFLDMNSW